MNRTINIFVLIMIFIMLLLNTVQADPELNTNIQSPTLKWAATGIGGSNQGVSLGFSLSAQTGKHLYIFRGIHNSEAEIFGLTPNETVWDLGMLYGRRFQSQYGIVTLAGGISAVGGVNRGKFIENNWFTQRYELTTFMTLGIPVELQLVWTPWRHAGLGINVFANANPEKSFSGFMFTLEFGQLR